MTTTIYTLLKSAAEAKEGDSKRWPGGRGLYFVRGSLSSSSSMQELQVSDDNVNFVEYSGSKGITMTLEVFIPEGFYVRSVTSGEFDEGDSVTCVLATV